METYIPIARASEMIDATPTDVWNVLTKKTGVVFMGAEVTTDWREGHPIRFKGEWNGRHYEDKGVVETFEPARKLAFTHFSATAGKADAPENYNLVTIALAPADEKTVVTLTQSVHRDGVKPDAGTVAAFEKNWQAMLGTLKTEAERRESPCGG